ncbi:hypothetical protein G3I59_25210 [Amycolatopsis rubida]|uniref:Uncharacterized protein n=1 Tax=Amycolatopsis rubida TaxID=112413 RepID=A0ABX0BT46_9PSEU|nr:MULTISPECIES: hypothetical protein [Amycolatopsis]MYW93818.1 hypothetical protein [Amycolatopsis rubida]NEC58807.1 hypothetical protein [Amycolatopsis rubida]
MLVGVELVLPSADDIRKLAAAGRLHELAAAAVEARDPPGNLLRFTPARAE